MADANRRPTLILPGGDAQAKYWIDPAGRFERVAIVGETDRSHEEWASEHGSTLEGLFEQGWIRVQFVPPSYLYVDFTRPVSANQLNAVALLLFGDRHKIKFDKIVIEINHDARTFLNNQAAFDHVNKHGQQSKRPQFEQAMYTMNESELLEEIKKAYKVHELRPVRGSFLGHGEGRDLACPLVCLAIHRNVVSRNDPEGAMHDVASAVIEWAAQQFGDDWLKGFLDGFDLQTRRQETGAEYLDGYAVGVAIAEQILPHGV